MKAALLLSAGAILTALSCTAPALAAEDEINEMPEGIIAKMARMRSKSGDMSGRDRDGDSLLSRKSGDSAACGSLNIGNVEAGRAGTRAPKQVIVVVKGPVINANNKCSR